MTAIFKYIAYLLNNYIVDIECVGREEKAAPYRANIAQLSNVEALSRIHTSDKSNMIEAIFRRLLEKQLKLRKEIQKKKDEQRADSMKSSLLVTLYILI